MFEFNPAATIVMVAILKSCRSKQLLSTTYFLLDIVVEDGDDAIEVTLRNAQLSKLQKGLRFYQAPFVKFFANVVSFYLHLFLCHELFSNKSNYISYAVSSDTEHLAKRRCSTQHSIVIRGLVSSDNFSNSAFL